MNFLAHMYLSGNDSELLVGNFIADVVKGDHWKKYPKRIADGIKLHRAIDYYMDTHEEVRKASRKLQPKYGKYTPILMDIFFDHILAWHWDNYHRTPLKTYIKQVYTELEQYQDLFPKKMAYMYTYMVAQDWLYRYESLEGIAKTLKAMSLRMANPTLAEAQEDLRRDRDFFKESFIQFFPQIKNYLITTFKIDFTY